MASVHSHTFTEPTPTYRGWDIEFVHPPIPFRGCDWCAVDPNSDGEIAVYSGTYTGLLGEVDAYFEEHQA